MGCVGRAGPDGQGRACRAGLLGAGQGRARQCRAGQGRAGQCTTVQTKVVGVFWVAPVDSVYALQRRAVHYSAEKTSSFNLDRASGQCVSTCSAVKCSAVQCSAAQRIAVPSKACTLQRNADVLLWSNVFTCVADACLLSPARDASVITVAATNQYDVMPSFSDGGVCVDILGPGYSILSAHYGSNTGTS